MQVQETTVSKIVCKGCLRERIDYEVDGKRIKCPICNSMNIDRHDIVVAHMPIIGGK